MTQRRAQRSIQPRGCEPSRHDEPYGSWRPGLPLPDALPLEATLSSSPCKRSTSAAVKSFSSCSTEFSDVKAWIVFCDQTCWCETRTRDSKKKQAIDNMRCHPTKVLASQEDWESFQIRMLRPVPQVARRLGPEWHVPFLDGHVRPVDVGPDR